MTNNDNVEQKRRGIPSRTDWYIKASRFGEEALAVTAGLLKSRNDNVKLGACKIILECLLPKHFEITGRDGEPLKLAILVGLGFLPKETAQELLTNDRSRLDYLPTSGTVTTTSAGSVVPGQPQVQDNNLAQTSKEDNNGTIRTG